MGTFKNRWKKLAAGKKYRESFVAATVKQAVPFQIRALMKQQRLSQEELAGRARLTQGAISRAANPRYGNLSVNTLVRIAAGFDVALECRFVPFSELDRRLDHLEAESRVPDFEEENRFCEDLFDRCDDDELARLRVEAEQSAAYRTSSDQLAVGARSGQEDQPPAGAPNGLHVVPSDLMTRLRELFGQQSSGIFAGAAEQHTAVAFTDNKVLKAILDLDGQDEDSVQPLAVASNQ
jgi:transcriptional regulator with XRE-family HTH domain